MPQLRHSFDLFATPGFVRLLAADIINFSGTAMTPIAIAFGVLALTGSTASASFVIAAPTTAAIVMLLMGGVLADRTSRQRQMVFAGSLSAIAQAVMAVLFLTHHATVPVLAGLMLAKGIADGLNYPAATGFVPLIVNPERLQAANSLLGVARSGAIMLGAAIAGVLVASVGAGVTLAVDAATYMVAAVLIASISARPQPQSEKASVFEDLRLGWREFIRHQWLWTIVLQFSLVVAAGEAVSGLLGPAVARASMHGAVDWGFIAASMGAGTIAGGVIALKIDVKRPMLVATLCVLFWAPESIALSVPLSVSLVALTAFVNGITGQIFMVLWYTTLQTRIPAHLLSRVSAYDSLGSIALAPLGIVVGGILFQDIGARATLLIAAATIVVPTLLVLLVPDVRRLTSVHTIEPAS